MGGPFARAIAMFAAIKVAMALPVDERGEALRGIPPYRSRGKGRGGPEPRYGSARSVYQPHQGKRECARRLNRVAA